MVPAPMNPTPVSIPVSILATESGSGKNSKADAVIMADVIHTIMLVLNPAGWRVSSLSNPIIPPKMACLLYTSPSPRD